MITNSSIMLGLGETDEEVKQAMIDLRAIGVDILTLDQYLHVSPVPAFDFGTRYFQFHLLTNRVTCCYIQQIIKPRNSSFGRSMENRGFPLCCQWTSGKYYMQLATSLYNCSVNNGTSRKN